MRSPPARFDAVAELVQRLAVLLDAGLTPVSAWRQLAIAEGDDVGGAPASAPTPAMRVADGLTSSHELLDRLGAVATDAPAAERSAWSALAAAWQVAAQAGAPLAPTLARLSEVLRELAQQARDVDTALAGPRATSRVVLGLPVVGLLLGVLLGFDVLAAFATPAGLACLAVGGGLIAVAVHWNRSLIAGARAHDAAPGLALDLLAVALAGGASVDHARQAVDDALATAGLDGVDDDVDAVLRFAHRAGVPVAGLVRAQADERRRVARAAAARRAARLETRLLLPLGLCVLPAFVALGVAPIGIAIVSSTALAL